MVKDLSKSHIFLNGDSEEGFEVLNNADAVSKLLTKILNDGFTLDLIIGKLCQDLNWNFIVVHLKHGVDFTGIASLSGDLVLILLGLEGLQGL